MITPSLPVLRRYAGHAAGCIDCFVDAVRNGTSPHYSATQARAWAPDEAHNWDWHDRLDQADTWVAVREVRIEGFVSLNREGYLDFLYVRPTWRGTGLASTLYDKMLGEAHAKGLGRLTSDASLLARPFLERRGWEVTDHQIIERGGVELPRFGMALAQV